MHRKHSLIRFQQQCPLEKDEVTHILLREYDQNNSKIKQKQIKIQKNRKNKIVWKPAVNNDIRPTQTNYNFGCYKNNNKFS